ncbi:MAG TPA: hypothetical protein DCX07_00050 [Phycisphaerales bacterium]|nr:hypothetical protein [Phycisphaerales bacterium]
MSEPDPNPATGGQIAPQPVQAVEPARAAESCAYCGGRLFPQFYFCLSCGTPYKSPDSVVPILRPRVLTDGELIEQKAPHVMNLFWIYLGTLTGAWLLSAGVFGLDRPDMHLLITESALLVATCVLAAIHWRALAVQWKVFGLFHPAAWVALAALAPLLAVNYAWHVLFLQKVAGLDGGDTLSRLRELGLGTPALVILICVLPAVLEETAFRGLVQHWLQVAVRPGKAILLAAALFTVLHFSVFSAPYLLCVGLLLGWARYKTGSLYPPMLIHFLHNLVVLEFFGG